MTIPEIDKEISKHRKLLNRSVGNQHIVSINWHHYQIITLINQKETILRHTPPHPIFGVLNEKLFENTIKKMEDILMNGEDKPNKL